MQKQSACMSYTIKTIYSLVNPRIWIICTSIKLSAYFIFDCQYFMKYDLLVCWARSKFAYASIVGICACPVAHSIESSEFQLQFEKYLVNTWHNRQMEFRYNIFCCCWWFSRFHQEFIVKNHQNRPYGLPACNCHYHTYDWIFSIIESIVRINNSKCK